MAYSQSSISGPHGNLGNSGGGNGSAGTVFIVDSIICPTCGRL